MISEKWKDRIWTLTTLLVGALIAFGATFWQRSIQQAQERDAIISIIRTDVERHVKSLTNLSVGFNNVKKGIPGVSKQAPTLDRAFKEGPMNPFLGIPPHKSDVLQSVIPRLHLLPPQQLTIVLSFYSSLANCEFQRADCEKALEARALKTRTDLAPICDVYLDIIEDTKENGKQLIEALSR